MVMYLILGAHFLSGRETDIETATCLQTGLGTDFLFLSVLKTCLCSTIPLRENRHEPAPAGTQSRTYRLPLPQHTFPPPPPGNIFFGEAAGPASPRGGKLSPTANRRRGQKKHLSAGRRRKPSCPSYSSAEQKSDLRAAISASLPVSRENIRSLFQKELKSE